MHPYAKQPTSAFWRNVRAVGEPEGAARIWLPKFPITPDQKIATYGSCFAQHIGPALADAGYCWLQAEPAPDGLGPAAAREFGYDRFSSRTGNIYTTSMLHRWAAIACEGGDWPTEIWQHDGQMIDPFRPAMAPGGFADAGELRRSRRITQKAFRRSVAEADVLIFTLGLTERWINHQNGCEYPLCPGTKFGQFLPQSHRFETMDHAQVLHHLSAALAIMRRQNPALQFLLTVSPVPLAATASDHHVLVANEMSKSVLRAVAGQLAAKAGDVDYFPSYELIRSPVFAPDTYGPDWREIRPKAVTRVIDTFLAAQARQFGAPAMPEPRPASPASEGMASQCDEELLAAFGRPS